MVNEQENRTKKGVLAVIFDNNGTLYFLIMHRVLKWSGWECVKGEIEGSETEEQAIVREVKEETGLARFKVHKKIEFPMTFESSGTYYTHTIFLIEASMNTPVTLSGNKNKEHDTYLWTTKENVLAKLTHESQKQAFMRAYEEIKKIAK